MKTRSLPAYLLLLFVLASALYSCGGMRVSYDYDTQADFSDYTTYNYREELASGLSEFDERRLLQAMDSVMQSLGIQYSEEPDFYINIYSQGYTEPNRNSVGVGVGGTGRNVGGGVSVGIPVGRDAIYREFYIDFVGSQDNALLWQAIVSTKFNPMADAADRERFFRELVRKVFEEYPPE